MFHAEIDNCDVYALKNFYWFDIYTYINGYFLSDLKIITNFGLLWNLCFLNIKCEKIENSIKADLFNVFALNETTLISSQFCAYASKSSNTPVFLFWFYFDKAFSCILLHSIKVDATKMVFMSFEASFKKAHQMWYKSIKIKTDMNQFLNAEIDIKIG